MSNDLKWLIGSDFHIPYENPRYMDIWWQVCKWLKPDVIDILGDLDDNSACSRYSRGTVDEVVNASAKYSPQIKDFFKKLRENTAGQIHFATGNHEIRYDNYIESKAPALQGLITPELMWGTDEYGVELSYYNNPPTHRFGDIYAHHGLYAVGKSGESVRKMLDDYNVSMIVGHSHRQGAVFQTYELKNEVLRGYELGHMTDIYSEGMGYTAVHNWQPGFAIAHVENGQYPHVNLVSISPDYTAYVDGKKFAG